LPIVSLSNLKTLNFPLIAILFEAAQNGKPEILSCKGYILCSFTEKWYYRVFFMNYRNHITIEANKRGGKPCVRGLRITVYEVLEYLASEMTEAEILDDFPDLTREDLKACIAFDIAS
jgi:uncharacterized protein (DUF433 family)